MCGLAERPEVHVVSHQYGSPTYVPHLADGLARLIETEAYGTYHMAGKGTSWFELTCTLYRHLGIATPVHPVATSEFPCPAERPRYSVLTTVQYPAINLPPWEEGVAAFAQAVRSRAAS
jgi:dTDP-4-dehydrorhamnose reductase